jgi:hypothetical protein
MPFLVAVGIGVKYSAKIYPYSTHDVAVLIFRFCLVATKGSYA